MNKKKVIIVTPVHNRKEITLKCLKSIFRLNQDNLEIHTIIVDDGSTDGTTEAVNNQFPNVETIKGDGNLWFTEGTNVGVRAALKHNPDYVLMINDDQVFDENAVKSMVETAEKYPRSIVGSLLLLWDTPHKLFQTSPKWDTWSGGWRHWFHQTVWTVPEKPWKVDLIVGNCVLVPVQAINEAGVMNSKRYPNFGDAEYTPRLRKLGWKLLVDPKARVFCQPNNLPPKVLKMGVGKMFKALVVDLGHTHNLRRRFYSNIDGAPTKMLGVAGFMVFFLRLLFRKNSESKWAETQVEKPISEMFKDSIVK